MSKSGSSCLLGKEKNGPFKSSLTQKHFSHTHGSLLLALNSVCTKLRIIKHKPHSILRHEALELAPLEIDGDLNDMNIIHEIVQLSRDCYPLIFTAESCFFLFTGFLSRYFIRKKRRKFALKNLIEIRNPSLPNLSTQEQVSGFFTSQFLVTSRVK